MFTATLFASAVIIIIVLTLTYRLTANYKKGMLFAITLPPHAIEHPQLIQIQQHYKKKSNLNTIIVCLTALPLLIFHNAYSLQTFYFFIWTGVLILTTIFPFRRAMMTNIGQTVLPIIILMISLYLYQNESVLAKPLIQAH